MVSGVSVKDGVFALTTPAGATIDLKADQVARLDYTKGRLEYLSDFKQGENVKVVGKSNLADSSDPEKWHVYLDTNINKQKIVVGGTSYLKGLGLVPQVELTYDLNGEFREFEAVGRLRRRRPRRRHGHPHRRGRRQGAEQDHASRRRTRRTSTTCC